MHARMIIGALLLWLWSPAASAQHPEGWVSCEFKWQEAGKPANYRKFMDDCVASGPETRHEAVTKTEPVPSQPQQTTWPDPNKVLSHPIQSAQAPATERVFDQRKISALLDKRDAAPSAEIKTSNPSWPLFGAIGIATVIAGAIMWWRQRSVPKGAEVLQEWSPVHITASALPPRQVYAPTRKKGWIRVCVILVVSGFFIYSKIGAEQREEARQECLKSHPLTERQKAAQEHFGRCFLDRRIRTLSDRQLTTLFIRDSCYSDDRDDPFYEDWMSAIDACKP